MRWRAGAVAFATAAPLLAGSQPLAWHAEAGLMQRSLIESDASGARLLREQGPMARVALQATVAPGWLRAELAQGRLGYQGQTQGGASLASHSTHTELELAGGWQGGPAAVLEGLRLGLAQRWLRREIAGTSQAGGLRETSGLTLAQVAFDGPTWRAGAWAWQPAAAMSLALRQRLSVDFGGTYDGARLASGRWREGRLSLRASPSAAVGIELRWRGARQDASGATVLTRGGRPAGTVRQPRLDLSDWQLSALLAF